MEYARANPFLVGLSPGLCDGLQETAGTIDVEKAELLSTLTALLDGTRSWEQIWGTLLVANYPPSVIADAVATLYKTGVVEDRETHAAQENIDVLAQNRLLGVLAVQEGRASDFSMPALAGHEVQSLLALSEVTVLASAHDLAAEIARALQMLGITRTRTLLWPSDTGRAGHQRDLEPTKFESVTNVEELRDVVASTSSNPHRRLVVCATHGNARELPASVNRAAVDLGVPALYFQVLGLQVRLGPLVVPGETSCYECYLVRRDAALATWERAALASVGDAGRLAFPVGVDWLTVETMKFVTRLGEPISRGRLLFVDYFTGVPEVHRVLRLPRCSVCGVQSLPSRRLWDDAPNSVST